MKAARWSIFASLVALVIVVASCTESTAPVTFQPPSQSLIGELGRRTGLLSCRPLPAATASTEIGRSGGVIQVGPHTLVVPPGALERDTRITAVIPANSNINVVQFAPEGLEFERSAALTMSYSNCNLLGLLLPKRIAYIDGLGGILEYLLSLDDLLSKKVTGRLRHFSGYAVAW